MGERIPSDISELDATPQNLDAGLYSANEALGQLLDIEAGLDEVLLKAARQEHEGEQL